MTGFTNNGGNDNNQPFPGKIAVITDHPSVNVDDFHSADRLLSKYGAEKVVHVTWSEDFIAERNKMIEIAAKLAEDKDIKILIINQAVEGTNAAVDKFREIRNDGVFVIYCNTNEIPSQAVSRANLVISLNETGMGSAMVKQARKQGAKVFVHYSFPRHMALAPLAKRRDMMRETCTAAGLVFADVTTPDPTGDSGIAGIRQFILEDLPKQVAQYGEDTAFFSTNCQAQATLIKAIIEHHAIYPQPCCPSPLHGFPEALGIKAEEGLTDLNYVISEACRISEEKNMTDRLSTWPVSSAMMFTCAGAEYAIKWIKGEVPRKNIDNYALMGCMNSYIVEVVGEASSVYMTSYSENGVTYENYKWILMSYLDL